MSSRMFGGLVREIRMRHASLSLPSLNGSASHLRTVARGSLSRHQLKVEVFARTLAAVERITGFTLRDQQLAAAAAMADGKVAQMNTGEGKTLAAVPALVFQMALCSDSGVHAITANPYLAERDASQLAPIYQELGFSVSWLGPQIVDMDERRARYCADVVYGVVSDFGFDRLRDELALSEDELLQRGLGFALVDEADAVLIDEARTPMVIAGEDNQSEHDLLRVAALVDGFCEDEHYTCDRATMNSAPTDAGIAAAAEGLGVDDIYRAENLQLVNALHQAIRAKALYRRERDYLVRDGAVVLIDQNTGRALDGRSLADGLHQAIEAREGLRITPQTATLASISVQGLLRLYDLTAGMSGTATSDADEFEKVYGMAVHTVAPHRPVARVDHPDVIFRSHAARLSGLCRAVKELRAHGRPVLIGTPSVQMSAQVSAALSAEGVRHSVLSAKDETREAQIIAAAGNARTVTVATNMAGRGVDILLSDSARAAGGLAVVGTSRHESRRTDDQLVGRAGRCGDPGSSVFYLSADDELVEQFAGDRVRRLLAVMPGDADEPLESRSLARAVRSAQRTAERRDAETRTMTFLMDQVMHTQRVMWFALRRRFMLSESPESHALEIMAEAVRRRARDGEPLAGAPLPASPDAALAAVCEKWPARVAGHPTVLRYSVRTIGLHLMDREWREHMMRMAGLRDVVDLRSHARRIPVLEFAAESVDVFSELLGRIGESFAEVLPAIVLRETARLVENPHAVYHLLAQHE